MNVEEVAQRDTGAADFHAKKAAAVVQENRRIAGLDLQALGAKARAQVGIRADFHALPVAAGVELERDVVDGQLHEAPVDVELDRPVRAHGIHARDHPVGVGRLGGAEGGKGHVDAVQAYQRVVVGAYLDGHIGGAKQNRVDRQAFKAAVVGREVAVALEFAQVGVQRSGLARQSAGQLGLYIQRHVVGLFKDESAFNEEEAAYAQQGVVQTHANQAPVVVKVKARARGIQGQLAAIKRALEVDERPHAVQVAPLATLVHVDLQALELELEYHPVDVDVRVPVDLQGVHVGDDAIGIGGIGRVHEDQAEVDVF